MSSILLARILTSFVPEEVLVDSAIEALEEYREAKFRTPEDKVESVEEVSLKNFFETNLHEAVPVDEIEVPREPLSILLMKWIDQDKSTDEIMADSAEFEERFKE